MSLLAQSRPSPYFAKARRALQDATKGSLPLDTFFLAEVANVGLRHPACFAAFRWLAASFGGNTSNACETSLLSASKLPTRDTESNILELAVSSGQPIYCQLSAKHTCKGAGGRPVLQEQDGSVVTKKGPDSWLVTAKCSTLGAGSFDVELKIKWDIYTCQGVQSNQYNHFRVDDCSNLDGFQQWCKEAVSAAAALTDQTALNQHDELQTSSAWAYNTEDLRLCPQSSSPVPVGAKRGRVTLDTSPSGSSSNSSDSTQSVAQLAQELYGLRVQVSNVETTVSQHAVRIDQVYEQVQEHNDDLVQIHFENAQASAGGPSNAPNNSALHANTLDLGNLENLLDNGTLSGDEDFTCFLKDTSFWRDLPSVSSYNVASPPMPIPPATPIRPHPGTAGAAQPAKTACPSFDAKLTKEQMKPFVLQALLSIKPRSCSALDLSYLLWPEDTAMRSCMSFGFVAALHVAMHQSPKAQ